MNVWERTYHLLLALYPAEFRREYRAQMAQVFCDQCRAARGQGVAALGALWWRTLSDVAVTVVIEHLAVRKAGLMNVTTFKNHPDRPASLLFLIPGLLLSLFYLLTIHNGEATGYMLAVLAGVVGFVLGHLKILRRLRIWEQFALGFGVGFCFMVPLTPMVTWGIPALQTQSWQMIRSTVTFVVCLVMIVLLARMMPSRRLYLAVAGILPGNGMLSLLLHGGLYGNTPLLWYLNWMLGYSAAIVGIVVLGHWLARRTGILALLAVIVAFGTLNALILNIADIAQGKTLYGQIVLLLAYFVPLVICPAWLLFAPTWRQKKLGVLLSWGAMLLIVGVVLPLLDVFLEPHFFRWARPGDNILYGVLFSLIANIPLFIGLWLALTLYEKSSSEPTNLFSSDRGPSGQWDDKDHSQLARDAR